MHDSWGDDGTINVEDALLSELVVPRSSLEFILVFRRYKVSHSRIFLGLRR
jgi:hypothetical protein